MQMNSSRRQSLIIQDITVTYSQNEHASFEALHHIRLTVPKGTVCAVLGPSGCGKSTLIKTVAGLLHPASGTVTMDGAPLDPHRVTIGFMPQNYGLLPWRTALSNVLLGPRIRKQDVQAARVRAGELFTQLGIAGLEGRFPKELSGGQQQRVALARAFLLAPDLLLYVEEALYLGRTIVLMRAGGTIAETIDNPLFGKEDQRGSQAFFASAQKLREKIRAMKVVA